MIGVAIFTAPLQWLSANPILVYNVAFIASFVQAGAGMYVLARELTGRRDAALIAALAYAFAPMRVAQFAGGLLAIARRRSPSAHAPPWSRVADPWLRSGRPEPPR